MHLDRNTSDRPESDLTTRARIRDSALAQFAEHGIRGTTMRGIALAAGVSLGLVQHYFGSKEAIRRACDEAVVDAFRHRLARDAAEGKLGVPEYLAQLSDSSAPLIRYMSRATVDGSPAAAAMFDELAGAAAEFLTASWPDRFLADSGRLRAAAAVMAAMHTGTIVFNEQLTRHLGIEGAERDRTAAIGVAMLEVYAAMGEFAASDTGERIRASAARIPESGGPRP